MRCRGGFQTRPYADVKLFKTFAIRLWAMIANNKKLAAKLAELERKIENPGGDIQTLFAAIRQLMIPPDPPRRKIGFHP